MRAFPSSPIGHALRRPFLGAVLFASAIMLPGCGTYVVAKTVTGAGSAVVGGAVGAVKLTGRAAGAVVTVGRGNDEAEE